MTNVDVAPWADSSSTTPTYMEQPLFNQEMVFEKVRRVGFDDYEYQYKEDYHRTNQQFVFTFSDRITGGFQEPDENVNLKKLKKKLRSKKKMKELLLKYFRS
jgi:hypothetical protein